METIHNYLQRNLNAAGPETWGHIARAAGVCRFLPWKIVFSQRGSTPIEKVKPLIDFFSAVERGERDLPVPDGPVRN